MSRVVSPETLAATTTDVRSYAAGPPVVRRVVPFEQADDDTLRRLCDWHTPNLTRAQLLAACRNRMPCGYYLEVEEAT